MWEKNEEAHKETKATSTLLSALVRESLYNDGGLSEFMGCLCVCLETGQNLWTE